MGKSQIIKDLVNNTVSLDESLTRLKLILSDLNKPELLSWVESELTGNFSEIKTIPEYRKLYPQLIAEISGNHLGTYVHNMRVSIDYKLEITLTAPIAFLENGVAGKHIIKQVDSSVITDYFIELSSSGHLSRAYWDFGEHLYVAKLILPIVKQKALNILRLLEKEFGSLDDYDIDISSKTDDEITKIVDKIGKLIGGLKSVNVTINNNGDNNQNNLADGDATINAIHNNIIDAEKLK
jgi:hypothetical protein